MPINDPLAEFDNIDSYTEQPQNDLLVGFDTVDEMDTSKPVRNDLPIANYALAKSQEILADPDIPNWLKKTSVNVAAGAGALEQVGLGVANMLINTASNAQSLARDVANVVSRPFTDNSELTDSPAAKSWIDRLSETKEYIKKTGLTPETSARISKYGEKALPVALAAGLTAPIGVGAGVGKGAIGRVLSTAYGGLKSGSAFAAADALMDSDGNLDLKELAAKSALGAGTGAAVGGTFQAAAEVLAGAANIGRGILNVQKGTNINDDIAAGINDLSKQYAKDPNAKALHDAYREAGIKATPDTIFKGNLYVKNMQERARPLTISEAEELQGILEANHAAAQKLVQTVPDSLESALKSEAPNLIAEDGLIFHTKKAVDAIRSASYQAPEVRPVYDMVDSGISLSPNALNALNQSKPTTEIDRRLVSLWQSAKSSISKGANRAQALDGALFDSAVASANRTGTINNTTVLDALRKDVTQQLAAKDIGAFDAKVLRGVQAKIDTLMDEVVPGYSLANKHVGTLDIFPGLSPKLKEFMKTNADGTDVLKTLFDPKTAQADRRQMLDFFANGVKNTKGEMVLPGNPLLLKAAMRNHLNVKLNNTDDLTKPFVQRFVKTFSNTAAKRDMYNDVFLAISGKDLQQWTKISRLLDTSFQKHAENLIKGTKAQTVLGAVADAYGKQGLLKATGTLLNYGKQQALFKMMWGQDWNKLVKDLDGIKNYGQQVNYLTSKLLTGGAMEIFDTDADPVLRDFKTNMVAKNPINNDKRITQQRGF